MQLKHYVVVDDGIRIKEKNIISMLSKCLVCVFVAFLIVVNVLVGLKVKELGEEVETLKMVLVNYRKGAYNVAGRQSYQGDLSSSQSSSEEQTGRLPSTASEVGIEPSGNNSNRQRTNLEQDVRPRNRRATRKKLTSRSVDLFHDSEEETTYAPSDFRERENSFEHHGSFKYKRVDLPSDRHPRRFKSLPSVHFSGDTSKYILGQHPNFNGNGHLKHLQRTFVDWKPSEWAYSTGMESHFQFNLGVLTIKEPGLYFIYSQIYYLDEHDIIGYKVFKNLDVILQCTITVHTSERRMKGNTCYTAGMEYLQEGDTISIENVYDGRYSLFEPGKSFFGVIKLGDVRVK